jgi:tetratricopeptide (TPR) repeat protein
MKEAISSDAGYLDYYLNLSTLYESSDRLDIAVKVLRDNEAKFAREAKYHFRLAVLYDKLGKKTEAVAASRR